jgi:hypothetical protein
MQPLTDLLGSTEFAIGLLVGTVALLVALPAALALRAFVPQRGRRLGAVGPAFAAGGVLALDGLLGTEELLGVPGGVVAGLVLLWVGGTVGARTGAPFVVGPVLALPGALLVAGANRGLDDLWVPIVMVAGTAAVGATAADVDRRTARLGVAPLLLVITVIGVYFTVPDTELMRAMVGVALPLVLLAWPYTAAALGAGGAYAAVALLLWLAPIEGVGRPGAIVGALGAFGLLAAEPAGRALVPYLERRMVLTRVVVTRPRAVYVGAQAVLTLYASRVAGMAEGALFAALLLVPALAGGLAFGAMLVMPEHRRRRHRRRHRDAPASGSGAHGTGSSSGRASSSHRRSPRPGSSPAKPNPNGWREGRSNGHGRGDG